MIMFVPCVLLFLLQLARCDFEQIVHNKQSYSLKLSLYTWEIGLFSACYFFSTVYLLDLCALSHAAVA